MTTRKCLTPSSIFSLQLTRLGFGNCRWYRKRRQQLLKSYQHHARETNLQREAKVIYRSAFSTIPRVEKTSNEIKSKINPLINAGLPFVLFSILGLWVVSNAYSGKLREMETAQGRESQSIRQAQLSAEHDEMMERLSKIVQDDSFDNTKRIRRPEEILEERRLDRERRNAWHRRLYRWTFGKGP